LEPFLPSTFEEAQQRPIEEWLPIWVVLAGLIWGTVYALAGAALDALRRRRMGRLTPC
jgi:hypothetical protein